MTQLIRQIGPAAALLLALLALPVAARAEGFTLAPAQPSVAAGRTIEFAGAGFTRGERVATWFTAPDQSVLSGGFANALGDAGRIEVAFKVPKDAIGGRWSITAYGGASKTPVVATFEVQGRDPAGTMPQAAVAPVSGPPGTKFAFAALGFKGKERVSYWLTGPDSVIHAARPAGAKSSKDGRVDLTWTAPANALRGTWVITIQGLESDVARGVPFQIQ